MSMAFSDTNMVYKLAIVVLLTGLLCKWIFPVKKQNTFPGWAAIEIALTCLILSKGGMLQRV